MTDDIDLPESDRLDGAPHPRDARALVGQSAAETGFLDAFNTDRMHHAWLITGPRGVGKATLAWRMARFLLTAPAPGGPGLFGDPKPATSLEVDDDHPVARRMRAGSEPRLMVLRRPYDRDAKRMKREITVDEARKLKGFFSMAAADGGRRVVIVDSADELNPNAANAILKTLEEPPEGAVLLLVSHQPSRLLPTIRSRCRQLRCDPLDQADMARAVGESATAELSELAQGSVGAAVQLGQSGGIEAYAQIIGLFAQVPDFDRQAALALAESTAGRGAEERFDLVLKLIEQFLSRLARTGAGRKPLVAAAPGEIDLLTRLAPDTHAAQAWARLQQALGERARRGRAVNLDPAALILDMVLKIRDTAAAAAK